MRRIFVSYLGGFPGPLRRTLGIWAEEIEGLYPHDKRRLLPRMKATDEGLTGVYEAHEICELAHAETAQVLGVYESDFYAGCPALTVNELGKGRAYYMATRLKSDFLDAFYSKVVDEAGVKRVLNADLPEGVTAQVRTDGERDYVFVMNFSGAEQRVKLDGSDYADFETGQSAGDELLLNVNGSRSCPAPAVTAASAF